MHINVYNDDLQRIGYIGSWTSLEWSGQYAGEGSFILELPISADLQELCQPGRYLQYSESETEMLIKSVRITDDEAKMEVSGTSLNGILGYRFIAAKIAEGTNIVTAMRSIISKMKGGGWKNLIVDNTDIGIKAKTTEQYSNMTALQFMKRLSEDTSETHENLGFRIRHDHQAKQLVFEVYRPEENKRALFSPLYGNAGQIVYSHSEADYYNVGVAVYGDEDTAPMYIWDKTLYPTEPQLNERREMQISNVTKKENEDDGAYKKRLRTEGLKELARHQYIDTVTFKTDEKNLKLGDIAILNLPNIGMKIKNRVTTIRITSQANSIEREITLGDPISIARR